MIEMHKKLLCFALSIMILCSVAYADNESYDVSEPSGVSEQQLRYALRHDLKDLSGVFVDCEEEYGVNAVHLSAIAALESGWGRSKLADEKRNILGWTDSDGYAEFETVEECVRHVAKALSEDYLSDNGRYYSGGTTIDDIADVYSQSKYWPDAVKEISNQIGGRCDDYLEAWKELYRWKPSFACGTKAGVQGIN